MDTRDQSAESGTLPSNTAIQPNRDLFQARAKPSTFIVTHRQRLAEYAHSSESEPATSLPSRANFGRKACATVRRHVTRAIVLDPSTYASHSRYSQRQFDEESTVQDYENYTEDHDTWSTLNLELDMEQELQSQRSRRRRQGPFAARRGTTANCISRHGGICRARERRGPTRRDRRRPMCATLAQRDGLQQMVPRRMSASTDSDALGNLSKLGFGEGTGFSQHLQPLPYREIHSSRSNHDPVPISQSP